MHDLTLLAPNDDGTHEVMGTYSAKFAGAEAFVHDLSVLHRAFTPQRAYRLVEVNKGALDSIAAWAAGRKEGEIQWLARKVKSILS